MDTKFMEQKIGKNNKLMASLCSAALASMFMVASPAPGISSTRAQAATTNPDTRGSQADLFPADGWQGMWGNLAALSAPQFTAGGWLGVAISEVTPQKAKELKLDAPHGVIVSQVTENSPAAKAGLKKDDVITEYNGQRIEGAMEFRRLVRETPEGHTAQLSVWRDGHSQSMSVEIGSYPADLRSENALPGPEPRTFERGERPGMAPWSPSAPEGYFDSQARPRGPMLGVSALDLSGQLGEYFGAPGGEGVLVTEVPKDSAGEKAGLHAGDVIAKVNGQRVRNRAELREQLRQAVGDNSNAKSVTLGVIRKGTEMAVNVQPEMARPLAIRNGRNRSSVGPRIPL